MTIDFYRAMPVFLFLKIILVNLLPFTTILVVIKVIFVNFWINFLQFLFQKIIFVNFAKVQPVSTTHEFMSCIKLTLYTTATQL